MKLEKATPDDKAIIEVDQNNIPSELPILPLNDMVAFPTLKWHWQSPCSNDAADSEFDAILSRPRIEFAPTSA